MSGSTIAFRDGASLVRVTPLDARTLLYDRDFEADAPFSAIDLGADHWAIGRITIGGGTWYFRRDGQTVRLAHHDVVWFYKPPFVVLESSSPGRLHCRQEAFMCSAPPPPFLPKTAVQFTTDVSTFPRSLCEVQRLLRSARNVSAYDRTQFPSALGRRAKALLDASIGHDVKIAQVAAALRTTPEVLGRAFQRDFGVSPVTYRGKTRILSALLRLTSMRMSVMEAATDLGYNGVGRFSKQFQQYYHARPRDLVHGSVAPDAAAEHAHGR
jgi:AraC-like DNA-binding protein